MRMSHREAAERGPYYYDNNIIKGGTKGTMTMTPTPSPATRSRAREPAGTEKRNKGHDSNSGRMRIMIGTRAPADGSDAMSQRAAGGCTRMLNEPTFRKSGPIIQVIIELTPKGQCAASVALAADSDSEPAARRRGRVLSLTRASQRLEDLLGQSRRRRL